MKLSIIILNYNVRYFLDLCLQSVQAAISDLDAEIIVVDNHSTDDSCAMVKQNYPNVKLIENKENSGFSKGNNIGVAQAKGEYICILNPDIVVAEDTFSKILKFAEQQDHIGAIACRLIDGSGNYLPESKRNVPVVKVAFEKMVGISKNYYSNHLKEDAVGEIDILVGAFMLMKRSVYNQVKGFDQDYFMYGEDVDLSYKILKAGYQNFYFGETTIIHYKGESTLKDAEYVKRFYGAMQIFYMKHFKSNFVFDALVWLGIEFAIRFRKAPAIEPKTVNNYAVFTYKKDLDFIKKLPFKAYKVTDVKMVKPHAEVIFDANTLTCKQIIAYILHLQKNNTHTFKIIPKNSNFIIGSNDSQNRGEILHF
ncbi:glycosyltransferase family 2 protein [Lacinutrix sp. C3R15]|uniref:glycosyltransferase family 2 protein n=1 Tax=Flavobacteriaceae TaxID=49546 RepID=UPI001C09D439|nr:MULTISPECIES: glycosyltransferase family 2 protein [Flavobacteriaceae]MBU2939496.1 glycosyltransferase family 2 protein [Lacinutrix sp. C3R15]MDO6622811.1 glycosyltransferase family 2 protein [Oceanihabitans sp. 1_MG-2023]